MDLSAYKAISIDGITMKKIVINDTIEWKREPVNLVPTSIDTDGSIYNGTGYLEGYRLSSTGVLKVQTNTVTSGFIKATKNDVVRMAGTLWNKSAGYNYFSMYDENYNLMISINLDNPNTTHAQEYGWSYANGPSNIIDNSKTFVYVENGITRFHIEMLNDSSDYAYIRISAYGSGTDMFITVNEEIE